MRRLLLVFGIALLTFPVSAVGASVRTVDLATGRIDGHRVFGRSVAGVTAALGRPDFREGRPGRYGYVVGWGRRPDFSMEVIFRPIGGVERAWSVAFERGPVRDVKIGDLLSRKSAALQTAVLRHYKSMFSVLRPYACSRGRCLGELVARTTEIHLGFGTQDKLGTWLTIFRSLPPRK